MKPYGHKREDSVGVKGRENCPCCTGIYHKCRNCRKITDRARRKTARQLKIEDSEDEDLARAEIMAKKHLIDF